MASTQPQDMAVFPTQVVVCSESDPGTVYHVQLPYCPCKDFRFRCSNPDNWLSGDPAKMFCKHLVTAMARVAGWHRASQDEPVVSWCNLLHGDVKALLQGKSAGFSAREANLVIAEAIADGKAPFKASLAGVAADGVLVYDSVKSRYTLTLTR
jgi:hypothetical protein